MKHLIHRTARLFLPLVRTIWCRLPATVQKRLRPPLRRARSALGLGSWGRPQKRYDNQLAALHHLVAVSPDPAGDTIAPAPREPVGAPVVSVVVTAHDDGSFIDLCLRSIRGQELSEWECIVIDDASVDDTAAIVLRHVEADPRVRLIRRDRNVGLAAARNTGIAAARGEFVTFLDADDFMFPRTLGARVIAARSSDPLVAGSWCDWASVAEPAGLEFVPGAPGRFEAIDYTTGGGENQVISTSPLLRRDVVVSLGGNDDAFRTAEDFEFATRLLRNGFRLNYAAVVGVAYRQKRASMVAGDPLAHARNAMRVYDYMARPLADSATSSVAVAPYVDPPRGIPSEVKRLERLVSFLTFAVIGADDSQIAGVSELIPPGLLGSSSFLLDVDGRIDGAIRRHSTREPSFSRSDRSTVEDSVKSLIAARSSDIGVPAKIEPHIGAIPLDRLTVLAPKHSRIRGRHRLAEAGPWDVTLTAKSADAARELMLVGRELVEQGFRVSMVDLGLAEVRRAMLFEGIHRVAHPVSECRLLISSTGDTEGLEASKHLIVAAEPTVATSSRPSAADRIHLRGPWEEFAFSGIGPSEVVGWHTRHDRLAAATNPKDGQALRSRSEAVLVVGSADDDENGIARQIREALPGVSLLFTPGFGAAAGETIEATGARTVSGFVRSVISVGPRLPADALAFGTPVIALGAQLKAHVPGVIEAPIERLEAVIGDVAPVPLADFTKHADPLERHLAAAIELMA